MKLRNAVEKRRILEERLAEADATAKAWAGAADAHRTSLKQEKSKNETIQKDLTELRGYLDDLIGQASRDDGVDVAEPGDDMSNTIPWGEQVVLRTNEHGVLHDTGYAALFDVCVLSKLNAEYARHCVNSHDALMSACIKTRAWMRAAIKTRAWMHVAGGSVSFDSMKQAVSDAIEKGEVEP